MNAANIYLTDSDREVALSLSRSLRAGALEAIEGPSAVRRAARAVVGDHFFGTIRLTEPPPAWSRICSSASAA